MLQHSWVCVSLYASMNEVQMAFSEISNLLPPSSDETQNGLDWAGRGTSHVDFGVEDVLPLSQGRFLGHGMNGGVFETTICGRKVAWKRRYCRQQIGVHELREMDILKKLNHRHIIGLVGTYTQGPFLGLFLYPVAVCDLGTFLEDAEVLIHSGNTGIDSETIHGRLQGLGIDSNQDSESIQGAVFARLKQSIGCMSSAIAYLHQQSIRHKDIKPSNILLSLHQLWITDFGTSTDFSDFSQSVTQNGERGTPKYFAPEVAEYEPNGRSADIFSLACVFFEMIGLCNGYSLKFLKSLRPKKDASFHRNLDSIIHWFNFSGSEVESPADQQLMALVREMLALNPQDRPTASDVETRLRLIATLRGPKLSSPLWGECCAPVLESSRDIRNYQAFPVTVDIGNTHQMYGNCHTWRFFIHAPALDTIIANVHFFLVCFHSSQ